MLDKYSYLKKDRENRNEKLKKKHEKEKAALVQASDKTTPEEFIKVWFCKKKKHLEALSVRILCFDTRDSTQICH